MSLKSKSERSWAHNSTRCRLRVVGSMRIVSLVPSVTETLLSWGIEPTACTRFCEQPELAHVGGTKDPDIGAIIALHPDVVIVDREENRREDAESLVAAGVEVVDLHVASLGDVEVEMRRLSVRLGGPNFTVATIDDVVPKAVAFVPIWRRPWMTINASTYGASLLASIGITVSHAGAPTPYPTIETGDLLGLKADVVLLPTEPYVFGERHLSEVKELTGINDVRIVNGKDLFWWGHRTVEARHRLAQQLADLVF